MSNKFNKGAHYCRTPIIKREHKAWVCPKCSAVFKCKLVRGRLVWLMTFDGRNR